MCYPVIAKLKPLYGTWCEPLCTSMINFDSWQGTLVYFSCVIYLLHTSSPKNNKSGNHNLENCIKKKTIAYKTIKIRPKQNSSVIITTPILRYIYYIENYVFGIEYTESHFINHETYVLIVRNRYIIVQSMPNNPYLDWNILNHKWR